MKFSKQLWFRIYFKQHFKWNNSIPTTSLFNDV